MIEFWLFMIMWALWCINGNIQRGFKRETIGDMIIAEIWKRKNERKKEKKLKRKDGGKNASL